MYCTNCGNELSKNSMFCPNCGTKNKEEIIKPNDNENTNNHLANVLCTISLCLYFGTPLLSFIVYFFSFGLSFNNDSAVSAIGTLTTSIMSILSSVSTLAAYVLMIIARVKCPKSTYAKVVMWLYIALFVMGLVTMVVLLITCAGILAECGSHF